MDAGAGKRSAGADGFRAGRGKNGGAGAAAWCGGLFGEGIRTGRIAAARCEPAETGNAREGKRCVAPPHGDGRTVWANDWAHCGDEACIRNGGPRGADGFDGVDSRRKWNGKRSAGAGNSRAFAPSGKTLRRSELCGAAGNADRVGTVWLRARRVYGGGAAETREIRAG